VRDGSGIAQCVAFHKDLSPEQFQVAQNLTQESSVIIRGKVRGDDRAPGYPGKFEIGITDLQLVQMAGNYRSSPKIMAWNS